MSLESAHAMLLAASKFGEGTVREFAKHVLEAWGDAPASLPRPERPRPLTNAEKCARRRMRAKGVEPPPRDTESDTAATPRDTANGVALVSGELARAPGDLSSSLSLSEKIQDSRLSLSLGGTGGTATPRDTESDTARHRHGVATRGTRVPASNATPYELEKFISLWAIDAQHPEWSRFLDHWRAQAGQRGVKLDWGAAWRNWVRRAPEFAPKQAGRPVQDISTVADRARAARQYDEEFAAAKERARARRAGGAG